MRYRLPATRLLWLLLLTFAATQANQIVVSQEAEELPPWQVVADGKEFDDDRAENLKTLNDHFPFHVPETTGAWAERAEKLRRRVLVATGLWPLPQRKPLEPVIHGKVDRAGFTVERVYFESLPGHYVTGLLFRPSEPSDELRPGVLSPHGHGGRLMRYSDEEIAKQIKSGAEKFERSGRTPKLARCAQLARMGCVAFIFDMLGYADSIQIDFETAHRHRDARPEELQRDPWCFYSAAADLRLQSVMGLQTWNALRALDFLESLPDVDPQRLAVTGGSGGGTQSILLGAIDDRLKVSFPNGMVSTSMQGGCYCENCCLLRVGTGNVELAALFAPRPMGMTAADDWTREMMEDGYPELRRLYAMLGEEEHVMCRSLLEFPHNYNYVTRATMYAWMNRHLELGLEEPIIEEDWEPLSENELSVWNEQHPAPKTTGVEHEREVLRWFDQQAQMQLRDLAPTDRERLNRFHEVVGGGWKINFDTPLPPSSELEAETVSEQTGGGLTISKRILRHDRRGASLPMVEVAPAEGSIKRTIIWTSGSGKASAFDATGQPSPALRYLVDSGTRVIAVDLFQQGELEGDGPDSHLQKRVDDEREYSAFTFGYNRTLAAERVADLLSMIAYAGEPDGDQSLALLGTDNAVTWALPAAMIAGPRVTRAAVDTEGFRFEQIGHFSDERFVPGAVKYGDIPALAALRAPYPLLLVGEDGNVPDVARQAYKTLNASEEIKSVAGSGLDHETLSWLSR